MGVASASSRVRLTSDLLGSGTSTPSSFVRLSYARREASSRMQMLTRVHTAGESSAGHEDRGAARRGGRLRSEREREREINTGIAPRENHACNYPTRAWATPFHLHHPPCFTASFITFCPPRLPTLEARLCTPLHPLRLSLHFTIPPSFSRPYFLRKNTSVRQARVASSKIRIFPSTRRMTSSTSSFQGRVFANSFPDSRLERRLTSSLEKRLRHFAGILS